MFPFFVVFLPVCLVLIAWLFGKANLKGYVYACILHLVLIVGLIFWMRQSESLEVTYVAALLAFVSMFGIPWAGALLSASLPVQGPAPVKEVIHAYDNLTPEQQEFLKRAGIAAAKAGAGYAAEHLRKKGMKHFASALDGMVK